MNKNEMKAMLGMNSGSGVAVYKLNKATMSGDDGTFKLTDLTTEREKGTKPVIEDLGATIDGVILKMRWALSKYDEPNQTFYGSTEYDDKWKDEVMVFPTKDKGSVETVKAKYNLSTQRIVYFYLPAKKQIVRLIVKASALSGGDKNPNKENGLFEHIDGFIASDTLPCEFITTCKGVFRAGKNADGSPNKRKDHYAMTFSTGRQLTESEFEKVQQMMIEVNEKTMSSKAEVDTLETQDKALDEALAPQENIDPNDIPF